MTFFDTGGEGDGEAPMELLERALREGRALLLPRLQKRSAEKVRTFTLVAPVVFNGANLALIAMHTELPGGMFDERDLDLLAALARSWAPILYAAQRHDHLERENDLLRVKAGESSSIVGNSAPIRHVREQLRLAAISDIAVLITGETGTGKELAAREIHAQSPRRNMPLVIVNCAAIPKELFESELFGYEKGAFTGAHQRTPGLVQQAHGGTLFLDEIGDLSIENQARILRLLENRTFRPLGGGIEVAVDVRFVAASNRDVLALIRTGAFREDLFHRLNGMVIEMPPLRNRASDVAAIADHFLALYRVDAKRPIQGFTPGAMECLVARPWPGNVRELRNCIHRAVTVTRHDMIQPDDLGGVAPSPVFSPGTHELTALAEVEKRHIAAVLKMCNGNFRQAAKVLQIGRTTLYKRVDEYGIEV